MKSFIQKLKIHDSWLFYMVVLHALLALLSLTGLFMDPRLVTGINPWIKPIKFDVSVVFYATTMAWILQYVPLESAKGIGRRIAICLGVEIFLIDVQAVRGVPSHFNITSPINGIIFSVMGLFRASSEFRG